MWEIKATYNMPGMKNTPVRTTGNRNMTALGKLHYARLIHMIVPQLPDFEGLKTPNLTTHMRPPEEHHGGIR
jgi:hypothetical protein